MAQQPSAGRRYSPAEDAEATVHASARFISHLITQAIQQEELPVSAVHAWSENNTLVEPDAPTEPFTLVPLLVVPLKKTKKRTRKKLLVQVSCLIGLLLLLSLLILGIIGPNYNSDLQAEQQVAQSRAALNQSITQARTAGVPASLLQPVLKQEQQIDSSNTSFFLHPFATNTYQPLIKRYHTLSGSIPEIIATATLQAQNRAQQDVQNFQTALTRQTVQAAGNIENFSQQFSQEQTALSLAKTPHDYALISQNTRADILALGAMEITFSQLNDFKATITRLNAARLDVTALELQYQNDLQVFANATQERDFQNVSALIDAQYEQLVVGSVQAFPYISVTKLNELQTQISLLRTYGINTNAYQQRLTADEVTVEQAKTVFDDLLFLKQIDADIASMHDQLVQGEARYLVQQFQQEVLSWAKAHPYHDAYDGHTYALNSGYMQVGIGATLNSDLASATTSVDYGVMVDEAQNALFNLHMFESDYHDATPYNLIHKTDLAMLNHYKLQGKMVLMVSLAEQVMRVYQNSKLLHSFYVTTGRSELPSLPGVWSVLDRKSPIIFKSADAKDSPYWFPDTPIKYAMLYHWGGYFVHDAWWRASFGPGTQFPHHDASGNTSYNFDGSHGCVNLSENDAAWVYQHTDWNTQIVIY